MIFRMRPYQIEAIEKSNQRFQQGMKAALIVLPTGSGKTVVFSEMFRQRFRQMRCLLLVHRDELIRQAADKIKSVCGVEPGIEKGPERSRADDQIVVASVQTLVRGRKLPGEPFGFMVIDEAHHATEDNSYGTVIKAIVPRQMLGVTATPWRSDQIALSSVFEDTAYTKSLMEMIEEGWLVDIRVRSLPVRIDLSKVSSRAGDFSESDLAAVLEPQLGALADLVAAQYADSKFLSFCPLRDTSAMWTSKLASRGLPAAHVQGDSSDRSEILADYKRDKIRFLSNAMLLTEGYDEPSIDTLFLLRPTRSRVLFSQIIGRGTRPLYAPGFGDGSADERLAAIAASEKPYLVVLDPMFVSERHNVLSVADITATEEGEAKAVKEIMRKTEKPLLEALDDFRNMRRDRLAEQLRSNEHRDPYEKRLAEVSLQLDPSLKDWKPVHGWHYDPPTDKQIQMLTSNGIDLKLISSKGMANAMIDVMAKRRGQGLATLKQVRFLAKLGHPEPEKVKFADVNALVEKLKTKKMELAA